MQLELGLLYVINKNFIAQVLSFLIMNIILKPHETSEVGEKKRPIRRVVRDIKPRHSRQHAVRVF